MTYEASYRTVIKSSTRRQVVEETYDALRRLMAGVHSRMRIGIPGLTLPQMFVLRFLTEKGTATPKEVAARLRVTPGNVTGLVSKLEAAGLVTRSRNNKDRRVVELRLTAKARRKAEAIHTTAVEGLMRAFEGWSTQDILTLKALVERLVAKQ